ncbi:MAG: hypothetical protein FJX40_12405 [Alphaproteobacteria bacterium]|nr:hypothetical protein [Alphaproteobacteria bacterium]MBM3642189.1 hypothetical protein [Alphaproteobacteria bacterium]
MSNATGPTAKRAHGRSLNDFENLSWAEKKLVACATRGETCVLGNMVPDRPTRANTIRPALVRFLALGGDHSVPVHERGVRFVGAFIGGEGKHLDFEGLNLYGAPCFWKSRFDKRIVLMDANGASLRFDGSVLQALSADRLRLTGSLFLNEVRCIEDIRLVGAQIQGNLELDDVNLENHETSLICERIEVGGTLLFRTFFKPNGLVSFANGHIQTLGDQVSSWPDKMYVLDGFVYEHIPASTPINVHERIAWLSNQFPAIQSNLVFALQPWMQLSKILREQGHFREATEVDIARENQLRKARSVSYWPIHWFYGVFAGYGYKPDRVLILAFITWLGSAYFYNYSASQGFFAPSSPAVFQSSTYEECRKTGANWTSCPSLLREYSRFSPPAYSLDLILPVVHLGQAHDWQPIAAGESWNLGYVVRLVTWAEEIFGWVAALTLGAIASGLVKRKEG